MSTDTTTDAGLDLDTAPDLGALEEQGIPVHIRNQTGEPMFDAGQPVTVTVVGTLSPTYRRLAEAQRNRLLRMRRSSLSAEQLDRNAADLVAGCVTAWHGFKASGQPVPITRENVLKVFQKFPYVREQLEEAMGSHELFTERSSSSSSPQ